MNVAIAPASSEATSETTRSSDSGSSESRNAPPETGGISATSSPSASTAVPVRVRAVHRIEETRRLVAELERAPHVVDARTVRQLELDLPRTRLLAQRRRTA